MSSIIPLPAHIGIGITSPDQLDVPGFDYKPVGNFHNYFFTPNSWQWPVQYNWTPKTIDGFSPNLNKELHAGHLKNLAVGSALSHILGGQPVAMLGASLGVLPEAVATYFEWCLLANYKPVVHFDNKLPEPTTVLSEGIGKYAGCKMLGDVVIYRSDGSPTYAAHDLAFSEVVQPDYYLTGAEQKEHFNSLGLGNKHLPLGLLLGADGKKMRSSVKKEGEEANALSALELFHTVIACLNKDTKYPNKLAWNILAWQFNSSQVSAATKFNAELWAKPESPGLYITYTAARIDKALAKTAVTDVAPETKAEVLLAGFSEYFHYYLNEARVKCEPSALAHFALLLAKKLSSAYASTPISTGSESWIATVNKANSTLKKSMELLGMYTLDEV